MEVFTSPWRRFIVEQGLYLRDPCATFQLLVFPHYTPQGQRSQPHTNAPIRLVGSGLSSLRSRLELPDEMTQTRRTSARVSARNMFSLHMALNKHKGLNNASDL